MIVERIDTEVPEVPNCILGKEAQGKLLELKENIIFFQEKFPFPPLKPDQLKISANGIDLRRETVGLPYREGSKFENMCFNKLLTKPGESLLLGPALIDHLFLNTPLTQGSHKPDAIKFDTLNSKHWKLTDLYEFKSGGNHSTADKVDGFSTLLEELRDHPHLLPNLLKHSLSEVINPPSKIIIPKDRHIAVTFIYSSKGPVTMRPLTNFLLRFDRISG